MPTTTKTTAKPAATEKAKTTTKAPAKKKVLQTSPEQRHNYIEVAAYYIAERHGFTPGREIEDWAEAEAEVDRLLAEGRLNP